MHFTGLVLVVIVSREILDLHQRMLGGYIRSLHALWYTFTDY